VLQIHLSQPFENARDAQIVVKPKGAKIFVCVDE